MKPHKYTIEHLAHFQCIKCRKWWSIGDFYKTKPRNKNKITCPHCGTKRKIKQKLEEDSSKEKPEIGIFDIIMAAPLFHKRISELENQANK